VSGTAVTVDNWRFISSGETIKHGRVFLISRPTVGSSAQSQTSPRVTT
jgi:hypothetical protein